MSVWKTEVSATNVTCQHIKDLKDHVRKMYFNHHQICAGTWGRVGGWANNHQHTWSYHLLNKTLRKTITFHLVIQPEWPPTLNFLISKGPVICIVFPLFAISLQRQHAKHSMVTKKVNGSHLFSMHINISYNTGN